MLELLRPFRFDADPHVYIDLETGAEVPHITGMLEATGWIDRQWFTEDASDRGTAVHKLTADYDLGALDIDRLVSRYRPWVLGYIYAMNVLRPEILSVEEPLIMQRGLIWGGRPDRAVRVAGETGPLEVKSGDPHKSHEVQTALQAILLEQRLEVPAEYQARYCVYVRENGRAKVERHERRADIRNAREVISKCCR
jgi:hypothetical protein